MKDPTFIIIFDRASDEELTRAHAIIKERARGWWHHFTDIWIVGGLSAREWRDALTEVLSKGRSAVFILKLPDPGNRNWSYYGPDAEKRMEWMHKNFTNK